MDKSTIELRLKTVGDTKSVFDGVKLLRSWVLEYDEVLAEAHSFLDGLGTKGVVELHSH